MNDHIFVKGVDPDVWHGLFRTDNQAQNMISIDRGCGEEHSFKQSHEMLVKRDNDKRTWTAVQVLPIVQI